tara:strand:- start:6963 stop:7490 length:528 start_codon:yes stop_codon:yes gene_type:complete
MKNKILFLMIVLSSIVNAQSSIYNISLNDINGAPIDLNNFRGKYIMFVNVASECGFTKQYKDLEVLYQKFKNKLVIIGLPCNQFGGQEPSEEKEIQQFCKKNFGVSFVLTEKIKVKGEEQHELYRWLTNKEFNKQSNSKVRWNFQKYIVNKEGVLLNYFYSMTEPLSTKITSIIK